jgi:glyoxylase-like metal-dependent hydrolase (beta-lactamase superfamily II)
MAIPFIRDFDAPYEVLLPAGPRIRRLLARNPGPFTFKGTGVLVLGEGRVVVIDPGPDDPSHLSALRKALAGETVTHILVTHTHRDHSPAARMLKEWTGAKTYGFGPHPKSAGEPETKIEEGGDSAFVPDFPLRDGDLIEANGMTIECVHTPGHISNHLCFGFREENALFCGDHVMGWSTTVVAPPDGDMGDYLSSLKKLLAREDRIYFPTHGGPIKDPNSFVRAYLEHRMERDEQILTALKNRVTAIPAMVDRIYTGLDARLKPAASLTVLAHLIRLVREGTVQTEGNPRLDGTFHL